ncbi:hypothetical protein ACFL2H_01445, partial [Planctomycetota bacterium]
MNSSAFLAFGVFVIFSAINSGHTSGKEIGFIEDFSLATDRSVPLSRLIPGTDEYYYYHCLHAQNTEMFDSVASLLKSWEKARNSSSFSSMPQVREIRHRQALLTYHRDSKASLEYLKQELGLEFNHQRERLKGESKLPTQLSPSLISREAFQRAAIRRHRNFDGFKELAFHWLAKEKLSAEQRRDLLSRLATPDCDSLVEMIDADLRYKGSRGFGSFPIHGQLTLDQLRELLQRQPTLVNDTKFINSYLVRLLPNDDVDVEIDREEKRAHLDRVWEFVRTLPPSQNSLKLNVLFHKLELDHAENKHNKTLLLEYLKLPRPVSYANAEYLRNRINRQFSANLNADFSKLLRVPPIRNDEPLVREYLQHFFVKATQFKEFQPYIRSDYLKRLFAETKLLHGLGDAERWYAMLSPGQVQELKDRVEIRFDSGNRTRYGATDQVNLSLEIKNVPALLVKVYRINAANYYQQTKHEINTNINLDGLVAKHEQTYEYGDAPVRRATRQFSFPQLDRAGTYIIDFIGNGISSRALIRKGNLQYISRMSDAGQLITVIDESGRTAQDARLWMAGREYSPDKHGRILVPHTNQARTEMVVLTHGDIASLKTFLHHGEVYSLKTGFYVDRESLLAGNHTSVLIRPGLSLNGTPVSRTLMEGTQLTVSSVDHDGISTSKTVTGLELSDQADLTHEIRVPERTSKLSLRFEATVKLRTTGEKITVASDASWQINAIDRTSEITMANLVRSDEGYSIELVGKNGEPMAARAVNLRLAHRDFKDDFTTTLQSDDRGIVRLGKLEGIERVSTDENSSWQLRDGLHTFPRSVHANVGATISLPLPGADDSISRGSHALFELRNDLPAIDRFKAISVKRAELQIKGLAAGDYALHLKKSGDRIRLRISNGETVDGTIVSNSRRLEQPPKKPLNIAKTTVQSEDIAIQLANVNDATRVHVFATRYMPAFEAFAHLSNVRDAEPFWSRSRAPQSLFVEGRRLGEEIQYVLNRRYYKKFPGNMLDRPEVLLNPWAVRDTATTKDQPDAGVDFAPSEDAQMDSDGRMLARQAKANDKGEFANLDYLADGSMVALNLKPDHDGIVRIAKSELGKSQQVVIVAVDFTTTSSAVVTLPAAKLERSDLRLATVLPADQDFSRQRRIEFSAAGSEFQLPSTSVPEIKLFDSIESVFSMYETMSNSETLKQFRFILEWDNLSDDEKRKKYSQFACHELNFYLFKKDTPFFNSVVRPYLNNKFHKTFLDEWLLEMDLSKYLAPWEFSQRNVFERILLSQRREDERAGLTRLLQDQFDRLPVELDQLERFMGIALKQDALTMEGIPISGAVPNLSMAIKPSAEPRDALRRKRNRRESGAAATNELALDGAMEAESVMLGDRVVWEKQGLARGRYLEERALAKQLYRPIDKTREWAENNYYHVPIDQQNGQLVEINAFWIDYANHDTPSGFCSPNFAHAANSFSEIVWLLVYCAPA